MREIKFRLWDNDKKEMIYPSEGHDESYVMQLNASNYIGKFNGKAYDTVERTLMQFTGLHDKQGNEIYEWDIIKAHYFYFNGNEAEGYFTGAVVWSVNGWLMERSAEVSMAISDTSHFEEPCIEIIGNLYENPELIK